MQALWNRKNLISLLCASLDNCDTRIGDAAQYYRRSINSEIVARIEQSFSGLPSTEANQQLAPEMHDQMEYFFGRTLAPEEEKIVRAFRHLPHEKKLALLKLLS